MTPATKPQRKNTVAAKKGRRARLEARLTPREKELFEDAARLKGQTLTQFVVQSARAEAERTIREQAVIRLSARDQELFVRSLLAPTPTGDALRVAARRYRKQFKAS
jgi:uncharacterized protein (DUF1778 family)